MPEASSGICGSRCLRCQCRLRRPSCTESREDTADWDKVLALRCVPLMERALAHPSSVYRGFLTFTAEETAFLAQKGHDDFLLAYPTVQYSDMEILANLRKQGKQVSMVVDNIQQLKALDEAGKRCEVVLNAGIEVD